MHPGTAPPQACVLATFKTLVALPILARGEHRVPLRPALHRPYRSMEVSIHLPTLRSLLSCCSTCLQTYSDRCPLKASSQSSILLGKQLLGWTADGVDAGQTIYFALCHPDDAASTNEGSLKTLRCPDPTNLSDTNDRYRTRVMVSQYRSIDWLASAEDGVVYFIGKDATDRKAADDAKIQVISTWPANSARHWRAARALLRFSHPLSTLRWTPSLARILRSTITSWNLGAQRMGCYTESEVGGLHISLLTHLDC